MGAQASFELALVLDRTTRKVHRFDAQTGTYMGAFGNFSATVLTLSINQSANEVIVWDPGAYAGSGAAYHYNYNTGALNYVSGNWFTGDPKIGYTPNGANLLIPLNNQINQWNFNQTGFVSYIPIAGALTYGRYGNVDADRFVIGDSTNRISLINHTTKALVGSIASPGVVNGVCSSPVMIGAARLGVAAIAGGNLQLFNTTPGGIANIGTVASGMTTPRELSPLHAGFIAVGLNGGASVIQTYAAAVFGGSATLIPQITMSGGGITDPISVATVVAPEPAGLVALALGVGCLVRLRRRSA